MLRDSWTLALKAGRLIFPRYFPPNVTTTAFHQLYYNDTRTWRDTRWLGTQILKCPLDMWIYQEILWETRPNLIIETGTCNGGSALYLATLLDLIGDGKLITVDIDNAPKRPSHPRITYVHGSSIDPEITAMLQRESAKVQRVMVILDSDHSESHVSKELTIYHRFVTPGCYLIVEDTNINGHPVAWRHGPGPMEAVDKFLKSIPGFQVDVMREKFHLTYNPRGYLLKK